MHVDGQRRGRRPVSETAHLARELIDREAQATELFGHIELEEAGFGQLIPILRKEPVVTVVSACPLAAPLDDLLREDHGSPPYMNDALSNADVLDDTTIL
jgi:hypothetical protein